MPDPRIDLPASPRERGRWLRQTIVGLVMLPLSVAPFGIYLSNTPEGRLLWTRARLTVTEPELAPLPREDVRWISANAPRWSDAAAVLVYHGIGDAPTDGASQTLTEQRFAEHLAALEVAGMTPITARELAEACTTGEPLPDRAVMLTFDDGRAQSMLVADPLLEQAGWTATMFTISGSADEPGVFYAGWDELREYAASGTWDLQGHTHELHDTLEDPERQLPLLVNRLEGESLAAWRDRVEADLDTADATLAREAGVPEPVAFAYPFGAYGGDDRTDDPRIEGELAEVLADRYAIAFHQDEQDSVPLVTCDQDPLHLRRRDVGDWNARQLIQELGAMADRSR